MAQRPSILQLEHAFLEAWPAVESKQDGGWISRFGDGYTKRANSTQAMDPSDDGDAEKRLMQLVEDANHYKIVPTFRVTPLTGPKVIAALNHLGWKSIETSLVLVMPLGACGQPKHEIQTFAISDPAWYTKQAELSGYEPKTVLALKALLGRIDVEAAGFLIENEGEVVAAALATVSSGIGVYLNVVVRADLRGEGLGRSVMLAALEWSRSAGATWAAIQVVASNSPAVNLYRSLGFKEIYRYHYRRPEST